VKVEIDSLHQVLKHSSSAPSTNLTMNQMPVSVSSSSVIPITSISSSSPSLAPSSNDSTPSLLHIQTKMMLMLTESFSKLTNAIGEKTTDTKSDWPCFSGDHKKFRAWHLSIDLSIHHCSTVHSCLVRILQ
jgi:hypothetical protein